MDELIELWRGRWRDRVVDMEREESSPWGLPLIVRVERATPPDHVDALTASALAVVTLITDPRSRPEGEFYPAMSRWAEGWIRKVVRRARGVRWPEVSSLPGVTVSVGTAEVRALLPHPVSSPPLVVSKLQVSGLDLEHEPSLQPPDARTEPRTEPSTEPSTKLRTGPGAPTLTIALNPAVRLTTGKACAQVGHAAQLALLELPLPLVEEWAAGGFGIRIALQNKKLWQAIMDGTVEAAPVHDAGFTEVEPGTLTCAATFATS